MIRFANTARPAPKPVTSRVIDKSEWPTDRSVVRFIKTSEPDGNGRQTFTVLWWQGERQLGQVFHANIEEHLRRAWREGSWPEVIDAIGVQLRRAA